jgi:hypothetical protein
LWRLLTTKGPESCYIFFFGAQGLYYPKYSLISGERVFGVFSLETSDPTGSIEGAHFQDIVFLYIKDAPNSIREIQFNARTNSITISFHFSSNVIWLKRCVCNLIKEPLIWWSVASVTETSRNIFLQTKTNQISLAQTSSSDFHMTRISAAISHSPACLEGSGGLSFFANTGSLISEIRCIDGQICQYLFTKTAKFIKQPIPTISRLSPIRSCVGANGEVHVFFISTKSELYEMTCKQNVWIFTKITINSDTTRLFPTSILENAVCEMDLDYKSLEVLPAATKL